jgi:hypothetical protein
VLSGHTCTQLHQNRPSHMACLHHSCATPGQLQNKPKTNPGQYHCDSPTQVNNPRRPHVSSPSCCCAGIQCSTCATPAYSQCSHSLLVPQEHLVPSSAGLAALHPPLCLNPNPPHAGMQHLHMCNAGLGARLWVGAVCCKLVREGCGVASSGGRGLGGCISGCRGHELLLQAATQHSVIHV